MSMDGVLKVPRCENFRDGHTGGKSRGTFGTSQCYRLNMWAISKPHTSVNFWVDPFFSLCLVELWVRVPYSFSSFLWQGITKSTPIPANWSWVCSKTMEWRLTKKFAGMNHVKPYISYVMLRYSWVLVLTIFQLKLKYFKHDMARLSTKSKEMSVILTLFSGS